MPAVEGGAATMRPLWVHEIKHDGLYEASRVKKFFEINIFSFPAVQEASRRVSAVLR